ncbi:biotin/lipoyl-binding protein [bacterium]|nr:biotin/lipoyl-binding protein [bacterium]
MKEKELKLEINGEEYTVVINKFTAYDATLTVNGREYTVGLKDLGIDQIADVNPKAAVAKKESETAKKSRPAPSLHRPAELANAKSVMAPLPGLILSVFIKPGDTVKTGQRLLMLEAMKMENEVNANQEGLVKEVRFKEGDSVNQGEVLIVLE